jgi:hypothetical protein
MSKHFISAAIAAAALFCFGAVQQSLAADAPAASQTTPKRNKAKPNKVIFSVTDNDKAKWSLVLNNAKLVQQNVGPKNIDVEIVVWGPGINMLKMESVVGAGVDELVEKGIKIVACEATMHALSLTSQDMLPNIGYVPGGVIELMQKQQQRWAYVRP